ncbi:MAG TPA: acyl-CoA dehydrogenase family protein [Kineosporiaceae bacterium]
MRDEQFRQHVRRWLAENLDPALRGLGGPGREHEGFAERLAWNRRLAAAGFTCLGWPTRYGGAGASPAQQVIFHEEYAQADAPARVSHIGEELLGPTLLAHGTAQQCDRFLPRIAAVQDLWCQGYSEPGAGSDLAAVTTRAELVDDQWVITGQKVWTSLAHVADWCFVLARTSPVGDGPPQAGLSYLLVPMRQPGVTVRPIRQLTGTSEFNEVFFDGARTDADLVVGGIGQGWRVAMSTLAVERGAATLGQQVGFRRELERLIALARARGAARDPVVRERLTRSWVGLQVLRAHLLASLAAPSGDPGAGTLPSEIKLLWAAWHRDLGELAVEVIGAPSLVAAGGAGDDLDDWQRLYLFTRADTIYGGSDEVQRTVVAERGLGLPRAYGRGRPTGRQG